ncbi:CpaF family protein [Candidatus Pacearchaeota archaeon]|nr:CpaF family protein [Candidatus Pacearchaeota archaeon]
MIFGKKKNKKRGDLKFLEKKLDRLDGLDNKSKVQAKRPEVAASKNIPEKDDKKVYSIKEGSEKPIKIKPEVVQDTSNDTEKRLSKIESKPQGKASGTVYKKYKITVDNASLDVKIIQQDRGYRYELVIPEIQTGTEALLSEIRKKLISVTTIATGEIVNQKAINAIKKRFIRDSKKFMRENVPNMAEETQDLLTGLLMQDMLGLGSVEFLINDPFLEEIVIISSKEPVRVFDKKLGWLRTNIFVKSEDEILNFSNIIARRVGRQISVLTPLLDAHIVTGDRANAVLYPISTKGHTITIRKFARDPWTIVDLIANNTVGIDLAATIWLAIEYEMNVLISGGTGSGKTVFLNSCMPFIPPNHRIISMEDTRELILPEFLYWCPLVTRSPNAEGKGEVSMLDLLINSLRMRPDRIVLGEIRRQREAEVLFEAMHTGHSVYATLHADTANETIRRLTNPPIDVPGSMVEAVNLNVVMFRDRKKGFRRVSQLAEFLPGKESVTANVLYRWVPERDIFVEHNKSMSFYDDLSRHTGMSQDEMAADIEDKKSILSWLIKNKIRDLVSIGTIMNLYYTNREEVGKIIRTNDTRRITGKSVPVTPKELEKRDTKKLGKKNIKERAASPSSTPTTHKEDSHLASKSLKSETDAKAPSKDLARAGVPTSAPTGVPPSKDRGDDEGESRSKKKGGD